MVKSGILVNLSEVNINELMDALKNNEFTTVRKWIVNNLDNDPNRMFRLVYYDSLYDYLDGSTIPHAVIIIGDYSYKSFNGIYQINKNTNNRYGPRNK